MLHFLPGNKLGNISSDLPPFIAILSFNYWEMSKKKLFKEERGSQTKSSQMIALSLDSGLRTLKPPTEAYVERKRQKRNLF